MNPMIVQACVGSSCYIKDSQGIIELLQKAVAEYHLENDITLAGCFCTQKCNCAGVTIQVDDDIYTGVTREGFEAFFDEHIVKALKLERG